MIKELIFMSIFGKKPKHLPIPEGFTAESVRIESSICTGEKTIGFYSPEDKRLHYAELVRNDGDIAAFYDKYGISEEKKVYRA